jgi:hypothetical protein
MPELLTNFYFLLYGMITIIVVVVTLARAWVVTHQASAELEFKKQLLQRGLSVEEIERLMTASAHPYPRPRSPGDSAIDEDSLNEVVSVLGQAETPAAVIEEVLWAFRSVDAPTQQLISQAIQHLVGSADSVDGEQILAVVRPLCGPKADPPAPVAAVRDERIMREV